MSATCTAFRQDRLLASGPPAEVALAVKTAEAGHGGTVMVFDDLTGRERDFDLRGSDEEVVARLAAPPRGPGRPKLGVTAREVTLLPRHWDWLSTRPGGASATLRRLVDSARAAGEGDRDLARAAVDRDMHSLGGDRPGCEAAARALYAGDRATFEAQIADWPADIAGYLSRLAAGAWAQPA